MKVMKTLKIVFGLMGLMFVPMFGKLAFGAEPLSDNEMLFLRLAATGWLLDIIAIMAVKYFPAFMGWEDNNRPLKRAAT